MPLTEVPPATGRPDLAAVQAVHAYANACRTCGRAHTYRRISVPEELVERWTWADPDDGHTYRRRDFEPGWLDQLLHTLTTRSDTKEST